MGKTDKTLLAALAGLVLLGGACLCCLGGVGFLPFRWFGAASGPVGVAKDFLRQDPVVLERLGHDLQFDLVPSGSVNEQNGEGKASLILRAKGPEGKGEALVEMEKPRGGKWEVRAAELRVGLEIIPLRGVVTKPPKAPPDPPNEPIPPRDAGSGASSGESVDA